MSVKSILVVDDDVQFGRLIKRVFTSMGHNVEQISRPREIVDHYENCAPDLILLDIFMPDINGVEVAKWLSKKHFNGKLVFMTGHDPSLLSAAQNAVQPRLEATVATLQKPARVEQIRALLNEQPVVPQKLSRINDFCEFQDERRASPRNKTLRAATIIYQYDSCTMKCIILDDSEIGAKLKPTDSTILPENFRLKIDYGPSHNCQMVHRTQNQIGVRFV